MIAGKKVIIVLPAYDDSRMLKMTCEAIPREFVDEVLLVDDGSTDDTKYVSSALGITIVHHGRNNGEYGANQKPCYKLLSRWDQT